MYGSIDFESKSEAVEYVKSHYEKRISALKEQLKEAIEIEEECQ